jgi:hypothetical protein
MKDGFKATRIQPINPKAMDSKTKPSDVYNGTPRTCNLDEDIGNLDGAINDIPKVPHITH